MTLNMKKFRVAKGKMVRKATGLPFGLAMKVGKALANRGAYALVSEFPEVAEFKQGCKCCGPDVVVKGPKGTLKV